MGSNRLLTSRRSTFPRNNDSIFNPKGLTIATCDKSFIAKKLFGRRTVEAVSIKNNQIERLNWQLIHEARELLKSHNCRPAPRRENEHHTTTNLREPNLFKVAHHPEPLHRNGTVLLHQG